MSSYPDGSHGYLDQVRVELECLVSVGNRISVCFCLDVRLEREPVSHDAVDGTDNKPVQIGCTDLGSVGEERGLGGIGLDGLGVEVDCRRVISSCESLVSLVLQVDSRLRHLEEG